MSRPPEPRPALRRAEDGSVHPAAPRAEPPKHLHAAPVPAAPTAVPPPKSDKAKYKPGDLRARKATKGAADRGGSSPGTKAELAKLKVAIPKALRKAARKQADADKTSVDVVVAQALDAWLPR